MLNEFREAPNCDVYVTGSNSRMLSKDVATDFRGRGCEIRVHPFSFAEYVGVRGLEKSEAFEDYLVWGGMPMAVLEKSDAARARYLKDLFARVYIKDILFAAAKRRLFPQGRRNGRKPPSVGRRGRHRLYRRHTVFAG